MSAADQATARDHIRGVIRDNLARIERFAAGCDDTIELHDLNNHLHSATRWHRMSA